MKPIDWIQSKQAKSERRVRQVVRGIKQSYLNVLHLSHFLTSPYFLDPQHGEAGGKMEISFKNVTKSTCSEKCIVYAKYVMQETALSDKMFLT